MIPPELVERVRETADIVQIIGEHVKLKRAGADFRGPCPFHGGKNPNFSVSPRRAMYHCFKCQESGNVFTFFQKHLGMTFPDAVRTVAATVGIDIPEFSPTERAGPDPREPFWEVNAAAADFFRTYLWEDANGAQAREYLAQRHISKETADRYGLGLSPRDRDAFLAHMTTLGYDEPRMLDAGLLVKPENSDETRPRFRNRLMFPILDQAGRYIAFGGRALGDVEPKYLNSPETPVFSKGKSLYALNWTRNDIRKADRVFVVEGYFDAIRLMDSGLNTVVAPLGTALTEAQSILLTKYTKNVYLLYDSDQAGLKATFRAGDELLKQNAAVRVITLPGGEDPDTFVQTNGAPALEAQLALSVDVFERKLQILDRAGWFSELHKKRRALDRLLPTIRATADPLLRDLYITRAAEKTGIAKDVLLRESGGGATIGDVGAASRASDEVTYSGPTVRPRQPQPRRTPDRRSNYSYQGIASERELTRAMLADQHRVAPIAEKVGPDRFRDPHYRAIFTAMLAFPDEYTLEQLTDELAPEDVDVVNELLSEPDLQVDPDKTVAASIASIEMRDIDDRLAEIDTLTSLATDAQKDQLMEEKRRLMKEIQLSGQPMATGFKFLKSRRANTRE